ncbi:hypothetical protein GTY23_31300, partial [Streptomyces sp. SID5998]|nr:hypothetical protein [Streptomyces sp. SID5998]
MRAAPLAVYAPARPAARHPRHPPVAPRRAVIRSRRPALVTALVALLLGTAAACGDAGGLESAGGTPTA